MLIATQIGKLFGISTRGEEFFPLVSDVLEHLPATHWPTFWLGLVLIGLLVALARRLPRWPGALAVSAVAVGVVQLLDLGQMGVALVGAVEPGLPAITDFRPSWADLARSIDRIERGLL